MWDEIKLWTCIVLGASAAAAAVLVGLLGIGQAGFVALSVSLSAAMMLALIVLGILAGCGSPRRR